MQQAFPLPRNSRAHFIWFCVIHAYFILFIATIDWRLMFLFTSLCFHCLFPPTRMQAHRTGNSDGLLVSFIHPWSPAWRNFRYLIIISWQDPVVLPSIEFPVISHGSFLIKVPCFAWATLKVFLSPATKGASTKIVQWLHWREWGFFTQFLNLEQLCSPIQI